MPEKFIMVRESEWKQMRKALAKCAEGWGNAVEFDLLPRRHHAAATYLRDEARAALAKSEATHPAPDTKGPYEARFVDGGMPSDCCEYGVISLSEGREVCRVWREQDARAIASALSAFMEGGKNR